MESISTLAPVNRRIIISVDDLTLRSIQHIVSIAPQEAQWFHTVTPSISKEKGLVLLKLSSKLYIPKQNTSAAQVDSTSAMMIDFYNELKEESLTQDEINATLSSMNCWCHSHHNMAPNPSLQDLKQFDFFINSALQQNQNNWQIMLIFNKRNQFYSRVYDPQTGIVFEGVEIVTETKNYDFTYIDRAAKEKFLRPKTSLALGSPFFLSNKKQVKNQPRKDFKNGFALELVHDALTQVKPFKHPELRDTYSFSQESADLFLNLIEADLEFQEFVWFLMLLTGNKNSILKSFTQAAFKKYPFDLEAMLEDITLEMTEGISLAYFETAIHHVCEISDLRRVKDVKAYIETIQL